MDVFKHAVATHFDLGDPRKITVSPMRGSANRLWKFAAPGSDYVVKELAYDAPSDFEERVEAAAFERQLFEQDTILLPEPIRSTTGDIICTLTGSRGHPLSVRAHRWLDGESFCKEPTYLAAAGASLHVIQQVGRTWSTRAARSLADWDEDPLAVLDRIKADPAPWGMPDLDHAAVDEVLRIIRAGEKTSGAWVFTHGDHKPENSLRVGDRPAIIDWDECRHCHPRIEAACSALRWAGAPNPQQDAFTAFLDGYFEAGAESFRLEERDFAKWLAELVSWFAFQARRAMGEWETDSNAEREHALHMSRKVYQSLRPTLDQLPIWAQWSQ